MERPELVKEVFEILKKYENPIFPLTPNSVKGLARATLDPLYEVLTAGLHPSNLEPRPSTGLRQDRSQGRPATAVHKIALIKYLHRYGFPFQDRDYVNLTPSLLEAAINYLWDETSS